MTPPKRQLGIAVAAAIVIANMIGSGVFTIPGFQAAFAFKDPWTMMSTWAVGGVLALCGAAVYAELGSLMPRAGGEYVYLRDAYHPAVGFMSGWVSLVVGFSAPIAAAALLFASYVGAVVPALAGTAQTKLGGRVQTVFTVIKVLLIVTFVVAGLLVGTGDWGHFASRGEGLSMLGSRAGSANYAGALVYVSFAYSGWNAAAYIAGEIKQPQRTLPRALLLGTGIVMLLYLSLNLVFLYAVPPEAMAVDPVKQPVGDIAARALFGTHAGDLLSSLIALALVSAVSAMMMAGPRVYATMAADHALPHQLARYSTRGVPSVAVAVQCVLALGFAIVSDPDHLITLVGFTLAIFAALTVGAVFIFRARGRVSPFRTPLYPITPLLFVALSLWIVYFEASARPGLSAATLGVLVVGALIYLATARGKARTPIEADE
ncbi:MAG: amino acid permease [Deltaproteobacteria bacterium]|nr:MAG: amino acid permease [Deltaproteobacteria bacterium]